MAPSRRALLWCTGVAGLLPLAWLVAAWATGRLGLDPLEALQQRTGRYALGFLLLSLVPTTLRLAFGWPRLLPMRRTLGLYAFGYALAHAALLLGVEYWGSWSLLGPALLQSPFIVLGAGALLILLALAVTSSDRWVQRLGSTWQRLHRLSYLAAGLVVVHYAWSYKELRAGSVSAGALLLLLLGVRLLGARRRSGSRHGV